MPGPSGLYDDLTAVLGAATTILGVNAPAARFVAASQPPVECPRLTVHCDGFSVQSSQTQDVADLGAGRRRAVIYIARIVIRLTRCTPVGDEQGHPPDAATYQASAQALLEDIYELYSGLRQMISADTLLTGRMYRSLDPATPLGEQAGRAGWEIPLTINVPGIIT